MMPRPLFVFQVGTAIVLASGFLTPPAVASEREAVIHFLRECVIGRTVSHHAAFELDHGKPQAEYHSEGTFTNLVETPNGFSLDEVEIVRQTNYDLSPGVDRLLPGRREDRVRLYHHELRARMSTGRLLGICSRKINSRYDWAGTGELIGMKLDGDRLILTFWKLGTKISSLRKEHLSRVAARGSLSSICNPVSYASTNPSSIT